MRLSSIRDQFVFVLKTQISYHDLNLAGMSYQDSFLIMSYENSNGSYCAIKRFGKPNLYDVPPASSWNSMYQPPVVPSTDDGPDLGGVVIH